MFVTLCRLLPFVCCIRGGLCKASSVCMHAKAKKRGYGGTIVLFKVPFVWCTVAREGFVFYVIFL